MIKSKKTWIWMVLIVLQTGFIWLNSTVSTQDSGALSTGITQFLLQVLHLEKLIPLEVLHYFLRKCAHFSEFLILGGLYSAFRLHLPEALRRNCTLLAPFCGLLTAVMDEFIQSFSGRGSLVSDVLIDFSGVMAAVFLFSTVQSLTKHKNSR